MVFCSGAEAINQAAEAAEKVTKDVTQLVADLALGSQDGDAVEDAYEQGYARTSTPEIYKIETGTSTPENEGSG